MLPTTFPFPTKSLADPSQRASPTSLHSFIDLFVVTACRNFDTVRIPYIETTVFAIELKLTLRDQKNNITEYFIHAHLISQNATTTSTVRSFLCLHTLRQCVHISLIPLRQTAKSFPHTSCCFPNTFFHFHSAFPG